MPNLQPVNVKIATTSDNSGIKDAQNGLSNMVESFQSGMRKVSVATGVAAAALTAFSKNSVDHLKEVVGDTKNLARQTGMTIEESSQLLAVMKKVGISADQASASFKTFAKQIADSRTNVSDNAAKVAELNNKIQAAKISIVGYTDEIKKNGDSTGALKNKIEAANLQIASYQKSINESANALGKLGIVTIDATGKNKGFNDILMEVADKFKSMPDGVEKTALSLELFGKSGQSMIKILNKGSDGIKDLEEQATKLGLTLTSQNVGAISDYIASQKKLTEATDSFKIQVGTLTAPMLTTFNEKLNNVVQSLIGMDSPVRNITANIMAFGGPILGAVSALTGFAGNLASAIPLLNKLKLGAMLTNPYVLAFAAAVALAAFAANDMQKKMGGWSNLLDAVKNSAIGLWESFKASDVVLILGQYFDQVMLPALNAIWAAVQQNLMPALQQLWEALQRLWVAINPAFTEALKLLGAIIGGVLLAAIWGLLTGLNMFVQELSMCISVISNMINWLSNWITWMGNAWGITINLIGSIITIFRNLVPAFKDVGGILIDSITAPFRAAYNYITDLFRKLPGEISGSLKNGLKNFGASIGNIKIPGFAEGGYTGGGGSNEVAGVVHKGEYVVPKSQVNQATGMPMTGGSTKTVTIGTVVLNSKEAVQSFFTELNSDSVLASKGLTTRMGI